MHDHCASRTTAIEIAHIVSKGVFTVVAGVGRVFDLAISKAEVNCAIRGVGCFGH